MATYSSLAELFTAIANAIRGKKGSSAQIVATDFPDEIASIPTGGGGTDVSDTTATADKVLDPYKFHLADGTLATGTIATNALATPTLSRSGGTITATETQAAGYTAGGTKTATLELTTKAAATITPSTSQQTAVAANTFCTGAITVAAIPNQTAGGTKYATTSDQTLITAPKYVTSNIVLKKLTQTNLTAENIKSGVTVTINNGNANVWSVTGTAPARYAYSGTLTASSSKSFTITTNHAYWQVTDTGWRLRSEPSSSGSQLVASVPLGTYYLIETSGTWRHIQYSSTVDGWIDGGSGSETTPTSATLYYVSFNPGFVPTCITCVCTTDTIHRSTFDTTAGAHIVLSMSDRYFRCTGHTLTSSSCIIPVSPVPSKQFYVKAWA